MRCARDSRNIAAPTLVTQMMPMMPSWNGRTICGVTSEMWRQRAAPRLLRVEHVEHVEHEAMRPSEIEGEESSSGGR
jgi:hypothetical protein